MLVAVHGSERANQDYRDGFAQLAERSGALVLSPLFPCGIGDPDDMDNYKYIRYRDIRFDQVLLHMVDEVRHRYGLAPLPLLMFGFSGGAHFAHRFLYLHPRQLEAVSICAPGNPTLLDLQQRCWQGVADLEDEYGSALDIPAMGRVAIHLAVGERDVGRIPAGPATAQAAGRIDAAPAGTTRIDRLRALAASLRAHQVPCHFEVIAGAGHERGLLQASAARFFQHHLGLDHEPSAAA